MDRAMASSQGSSWDSGLGPGKRLGTCSEMSVGIRKPRTQCWTPADLAGLLRLHQFPSTPLLPIHPLPSCASWAEHVNVILVITGLHPIDFRLHPIYQDHFEPYSPNGLQSSLLGSMHISFQANSLFQGPLPRKFPWDWRAVTGLEHRFAHETIMRACVKTLIQDAFIPSPLTTLLLSQNEIRLIWHSLFHVNLYSVYHAMI